MSSSVFNCKSLYESFLKPLSFATINHCIFQSHLVSLDSPWHVHLCDRIGTPYRWFGRVVATEYLLFECEILEVFIFHLHDLEAVRVEHLAGVVAIGVVKVAAVHLALFFLAKLARYGITNGVGSIHRLTSSRRAHLSLNWLQSVASLNVSLLVRHGLLVGRHKQGLWTRHGAGALSGTHIEDGRALVRLALFKGRSTEAS